MKRKALPLTILIMVFIIVLASILLIWTLNISLHPYSNKHIPLKAVVVDGLFDDFPNVSLISKVVGVLRSRGFVVDIVNGSDLTVDKYREIFGDGYRVLILRVHGGVAEDRGLVALFTSQLFNDSLYVFERKMGLVGVGEPFLSPGKKLFVISPEFIKRFGRGLKNSIVMVFSCYSSYRMELAKAFIDMGAKLYIGWDGPVDAVMNDYALSKLIEYLFVENMTIDEAVKETMNDILSIYAHRSGAYPLPLLTYYPRSVGSYTVWDLLGMK